VAPRANWKGFLKVAEVQCPVALFTAASTSDRIAFNMINRATGHRLRRQYVDSVTGRPVAGEDQVKGYEVSRDEYIVLEDEEIAAAVPESDKTLTVRTFVKCQDIDRVYFDRPYYLAPSDRAGAEAFGVINEAMRSKGVAALAQAVLFRRLRSLLLRGYGAGMIASTLNFNYQVRSATDAFADVPDLKLEGEMLELAKHIINTKQGSFDPRQFTDRYEASLVELVKAKIEGRTLPRAEKPQPEKVVNLMDALRESARLVQPEAAAKSPAASSRRSRKASTAARKAG
jgi:DNA end-binding protein Ku